jgi:amphi-Trp domain-containing protein
MSFCYSGKDCSFENNKKREKTMSGQKFALQQSMNLKTLTDYLDELVKALRAGKVVLQKDEQLITLTPSEQVSVEISAKQKSDKEEMSLNISWRLQSLKTEEQESVFRITQTEPELKTESGSETA